jgi:hypothetical protein
MRTRSLSRDRLIDELWGEQPRLSGPEALRPAEQVAILAKYCGRNLRFEEQTDEQARAEMEQAVPRAYVDAFFEFFSDGLIPV